MIVYRIVHKSIIDPLAGSSHNGRWCATGMMVIYGTPSIALCCLENIIRTSGSAYPMDFRTIIYDIPDDVKAEVILPASLKPDWRESSNYSDCQAIGQSWFNKTDALLLQVPSAILPGEYTFVIKTSSPDMRRIKVIKQELSLPYDRATRILNIEN